MFRLNHCNKHIGSIITLRATFMIGEKDKFKSFDEFANDQKASVGLVLNSWGNHCYGYFQEDSDMCMAVAGLYETLSFKPSIELRGSRLYRLPDDIDCNNLTARVLFDVENYNRDDITYKRVIRCM